MRLGTVIGRVTLSQCVPALKGARWLIVSPFTREHFQRGHETLTGLSKDPSLVVYDDLGGGVGQTIGFVEGREAAMPFEKTLAHKALNARIRKEMPMNAPIQGDEPNLTAGAKIYREHCAVCHGMPRQQKTAIAAGMYSRPPKLLEGKGVTDDEPGESY